MALLIERLREVLRYEPDTGNFYWRVSRRCVRAGDLAGTRHATGYTQIGIDGRLYRAHRLAWMWMTGEVPEWEVDHKDGDRSNDRWANLRYATIAENRRNSRPRRGAKGTYFDRVNQKWVAQIKINGKAIHLGRHATEQDAHAAYCVAAKANFGEFARTK